VDYPSRGSRCTGNDWHLLTFAAFLLGIVVILININLGGVGNAGALVTGFLFGAGSLIHSLFRDAKQIGAPHALETLKKDPRPPLLLLRAFGDDSQQLAGYEDHGGVLTFGQGGRRTFEEFLYDILSRVGPVIAIGRPGKKTPPLGASRFWVRDHLWRRVVDELLSEAQYTVLIMGDLRGIGTVIESEAARDPATLGGSKPPPPREDSAADREVKQYLASLEASARAQTSVETDDGITWEAKRLFGLKDCQKVILVMPPVDEEQAARRWGQYQELSQGLLPPVEGGEIAATFAADRTCRVARIEKTGWYSKSYARNHHAYQELIQVRAS